MNGVVDRTSAAPAGLATGAGEGFTTAGAGGGRAADGWLKTIVPLGIAAGGGLGGTAGAFKLPVWNIIVRPAASPVAGAAAGPGVGVGCGAGGGGGAAFAAGIGAGAAGAANIIVCFADGGRAVGGGGAAFGASVSGAAAGTRVTLNVFWHLPQRMLRPCGPMRASSTR